MSDQKFNVKSSNVLWENLNVVTLTLKMEELRCLERY